ncbi:hypothetical protein NQ315_010445 [Exocentrus adspersus]|uniref:Uncharacterized protein n=1 Tax=Exocentrus adspersus TaxID=1586481 RepID=A0AAV8WBD0_9CUCU|nr:hypothetical protein NQ315_010445 [Exocentrus adspersus]
MGSQYIYLVLICMSFEKFGILGDDCSKQCRVSRTHGMKSYDCYNKDLRFFPKCVPSDVEIVELSTNRIRKVSRSDLSQFSYLKILYLKDNLLVTLQNDTFADLDSLRVLDLSQNSIKVLPSSIFTLPSLKKLYLSQNSELNWADSLENVKPVLSPISSIDISNISDEMNVIDFPDFGPMPYLQFLNISENKYKVLTPRHFAGLCSVKVLININVSNNFENSCDCWIINNWLLQRKVQFNPFICPGIESECFQRKPKNVDGDIYNKCLEVKDALEKETRLKKIIIGTGVSVLIILIVLIFLYFYCIRNRRNNEDRSRMKVNCPLYAPPSGPLLSNIQTNDTKTSIDNL